LLRRNEVHIVLKCFHNLYSNLVSEKNEYYRENPNCMKITSLNMSQTQEDRTCWICLMEDDAVTKPCACPRWSHPDCIATWQKTKKGTAEETSCRFCNVKLPKWEDSSSTPSAPPMPLPTPTQSIRDHVSRLCVNISRPEFLRAHEPPIQERSINFIEGSSVSPSAFNIVITDESRRLGTCKVFNHAKNILEFQNFVKDTLSQGRSQSVVFAFGTGSDVSIVESTVDMIPDAIQCARAMGATRVVCASI
jgi:hypothetical protein